MRSESSNAGAKQSLMSVLIQLRKVCDHPYLFTGNHIITHILSHVYFTSTLGIEEEPFVEGEHLFTASGKVLILDRLLKYLKDNNHRVLIFSQMTRFLDSNFLKLIIVFSTNAFALVVNDCLTLRGYKFEVLDGRTRSEERLRAVENFQRTDSDVFCFLLSTKAGGFGIITYLLKIGLNLINK